ncbi:MAG: apolipoprotein N-acyltransferase [Nitrospirae bacterium]|nr:apolipoprotein N-acyltransferase [Nitrospirota bacterium]
MTKKADIPLAVLSGLLLVFSFPPFDFYPLAWFALVPLFIVLRGKDAKSSFLTGMLTGFVYFMGTIYWVFHSMYFYGYIAAPLSVLILIVLCLYLAVYVGVFSTLFSFVSRNSRLPALFIAPVLWVTLEFVRTYALTGFPWSMLGYSQYEFLPLIQVADITGVYGVSFLVAATNGAIYDMAFYLHERRKEQPLFARWPLTLSLIIFAVIISASISYGFGKLKENSQGQKIKVSVVQGNIEQDKKWDLRFQRDVIEIYKRLTKKTSADSPDLIVWPETAVPFVFGYDKNLTEDITTFQKELKTYLLFGSVLPKNIQPGKTELSNSAVLMSPEGKVFSVYDKIHLVPFGEYVPLRKLFPFIEKITVAIGDFLSGKEASVMQTPFAKIGNLICYEIIFPGLVRQFVYNGANVLVTITNDGWFGKTSAPYQHFSMAVLRAVENRVPVVRAANTGISGFIDSRGRIINKSDIFVEAALTETISPGNRKSFYTQNGDLFAYLCIICSALLIMKAAASRKP